MENEPEIRKISIIGGTGALGTGLALRWARAGYAIIIGSRSDNRAEEIADQLNAELGRTSNMEKSIAGLGNLEAAKSGDIVVLTVPFAHHENTLKDIRPGVAGKILVDTTVPLVPPKVARVQLPAEGSAGVRAQQILGDDTRVVSAFQNVAAELMAKDEDPECDVLVAGNDPASREIVVTLAERAGFKAWHAGPLPNAAAMEALTSVLIFMNKRYEGSHTGIRITGIGDD